jgi:hypothetical protein
MPFVPTPFVPGAVRTAPSYDSSAGGSRVRTNPVGPANTGNPVNPVASDPMPAATRYLPNSGVRSVDNGRPVIGAADSPRQIGTAHPDGASSVPGSNPGSTRGGVRVVDRTPPVRDDGRLSASPRDLYDRGNGIKSVGGVRVTSTSIADRYRPKALAGDAAPMPARPAPHTLQPRPNGHSSPTLINRYVPSTGGVRTASVTPAPRTIVDARPGVVRSASLRNNAFADVSSSRSSSFGHTTVSASHFYHTCNSSFCEPAWSWHCNPCWSSSLTWGCGIGCGSFGWGFCSWFPCHSHSACVGFGFSNCWWHSCSPCYPSAFWWWPSYAYVPSYYYPYDTYYPPAQTTVVVEHEGNQPAAEPAAPAEQQAGNAAAREMTPAQLARKYVELGDFYFHENRFADAADAYSRARTYAPQDATIHFALADAVFATGDYYFAAFLIGEALRLDPNMAHVETDKRLQYGDVKLFEEQLATLNKYIAEKPYDAMAELVLGYNLKLSLKPEEAEKAFHRVLEIDPDSQAARRFLDGMQQKSEPVKLPPKEAPKED